MQKNNSVKIEESLLDKIISVAYGDAGWIDRISIHRMAKKDPLVKQLLNEYKLTAASVHRIKSTELPVNVSNRVKEKLGRESESNPMGSFIYSWLFARPIVSTGFAGILIITICGILLFNDPTPEYSYTKAEIELAQQQFEHSLAIVGKVFQNAEKTLEAEVISKHVSKPLNKGLIYLNDYLIGG